jgi:peptidoglycan-associated lipoprotein
MKTALLSILLASSLLLACGGDEKKPPTAPTGGTDEPKADAKKAAKPDTGGEKPGDNPSQSQINISDEIKKACGISDVDAHFAFNSSDVQDKDHKILGQLATCFTSGKLAGREMRLVGHADPRGEPEYNMVLGGKRADNVKGFIAKKGMNADKIATTSRGEMDATGTDEASWQKDRRVDVVLGD